MTLLKEILIIFLSITGLAQGVYAGDLPEFFIDRDVGRATADVIFSRNARSLADDTRIPHVKKRLNAPASYYDDQSGYSYQEDGSQIDVLVLYTQQMKDNYGSGLGAEIQNFVDLANQAYSNSGIKTRLRLAATELFSDANVAEGVTIDQALNYITCSKASAADSACDLPSVSPPHQIKTWRDTTYKADLVSLLRVFKNSGACGLSWLMQDVQTYGADVFADWAFSVVEVGTYGYYYCDDTTFAHELGHNMGCAHDRAHTSNTGAYPYSYGYGVRGLFGDIMSYISPTITYFSTPRLKYQGYPIGIDGGADGYENRDTSADCTRTINNTSTASANFRIGQSAPVTAVPVSAMTIPYTATYAPVKNTDPLQAKPIGIGSVAAGGDILSLQAGLYQFSGPVDIYLGLSHSSTPELLYILRQDNTFQAVSAGLAPWKKSVDASVDTALFGDIAASSLPAGTFTLFLAVTPSDSLGSYYLWTTSFTID